MSAPASASTALVTGASSGIGLELARLFARDHHGLILVARREAELARVAEELRSLGSPAVWIVVQDLSRPSAAAEIHEAVVREGVSVDVLVNNAGFGAAGPFLATDLQSEMEMMQVNMVSLVHLTKLFLPEMVTRKRGRILNVASTASFQPGPLMAVYYATKAFVLSFSEALAEELRQTGVTVTALCPGPTRTEFQRRAGLEKSRLVSGFLAIQDAAAVASVGYRSMLRGRRIVVPGVMNWLLAESVRFTPRRLVTTLVRFLQERRG